MKIKFWGVRGSIPCPGPDTVQFGGNTTCIEIRLKDTDRLIIIGAGSGIRELGNYMMAHDSKKGPINTEIFLSHTHWDHIMGFPFFIPIYVPGTKLKIYGPVSYENQSLGSIVSGQLTYLYFPVRREELSSEIEYVELKEQVLDLGDGLKVTTKYLNHPILCLGYRFEYKGKIFCTCFDHEPYQNVFCTDKNDPSYNAEIAAEGELAAKEENMRIGDFIKGADLLIADAQYTEDEYKTKVGWGHTPVEAAIKSAKENNVKKLLLFHHDPLRTDKQLLEYTNRYCKTGSSKDIEIQYAREQVEIDITG